MIVVLDTNVLVSALLSPFQAPARVLDLVLSGEVDVVVDDRIMAEYREVLARPKFSFEERAVSDLLEYFERAGVAVQTTPLNIDLPDPDDRMFVEVAVSATATLVSGNLRHYPPEVCHAIVVVSPSAFLERWQVHTA
jgi:putative PIN family toxin of toxin-antitoxin system